MNDVLYEDTVDQAGFVPGGIWGRSEEVNAGQAGVPGQDGHHAARGAEPSRVHADATGLVPQDGHHHLHRHRPLG